MNSVYPTAPTIPEFVFLAFQLTFAIITVALISGALVERMNFGAWIAFAAIWSIIVYGPIAHWVWNPEGWLFKLGALDFAGGLVVHISSGVSALTAALFIGERVRHKKEAMLPSNIPFVFIGAALLWVGWFGFNAGSAVSAGALAGSAFIVTNTAAAAAAITWMIIEWLVHGKPSVIGAASGLVAGLVAITPGAGFVDVKAAIIIGIIVSIICYLMVAKVKKFLGYDDSLDAFGIHGIGGTWGAIATGLFANPKVNPLGTGLFYGNPKQLLIQLISVVAAYAIAIIGTLIVLSIVKTFIKLRVEPQEEIYGLDLVMHGEKAE
jgi:Amt family ammonium transporter